MLTERGISITPSTYYKVKARGRVSAAEPADAYAANTVHAAYVANRRVDGVRNLWHAMKRGGHDMGRDPVARLMTITDITGVVRGRRRTVTTERDERAPRHRRSDRAELGCTAASESVVGLRFHLGVDVGRVRLHRVLGRRLFPPDSGLAGDDDEVHPAGPWCSRASSVHEKTNRPPFHINRIGPSLRCRKPIHLSRLHEALVESGIAGSIGSVGDALDNALMESTIGLYKTELIYRAQSWSGRAEVEREAVEWVHWFNAARLHPSIDYVPPVEYETLYREQRPTVASILDVA